MGNTTASGNDDNVKHIMKENDLMLNTLEILDEEKESILSDVLRCCVCLELPVEKQVRICEKGHHFCLTCHEKMEVCGICRGVLLKTRNFVVEQLVTKLGAILGVSKYEQPPIEPPVKLCKGSFKCLHECQRKMPAFRMLQHLKTVHSTHLIDNLRSNPYSGRFSFRYEVHFNRDEKHILSVQVYDMGLFTVALTFTGSDLFGCVRMLADETVPPPFRYQLVVRIPNLSGAVMEFSVTECPVSKYSENVETVKRDGRGLKINGENLLEYIQHGSKISVFFSVWRNREKNKSSSPSVFCLPERHLFLGNDRKIRRTRNRNMRRKRLRDRLKASAEDLKQLPSGFSRICL